MDKFTERVIAGARRLGASYCDCRLIDMEREDVSVVGGAPRAVVHAHQRGFGVRVIANGAWGFSSSSVVSDAEADHIVEEAVDIAHASALAKKKDVVLAPVSSCEDMVPHQAEVDPFTISDSQKIGLLAEATRAMMLPGVVLARGQMQFREGAQDLRVVRGCLHHSGPDRERGRHQRHGSQRARWRPGSQLPHGFLR